MASFVIHHIVGSRVLALLEEYGIILSERQKKQFLLGNLIVDSTKAKLEIKDGENAEQARITYRKSVQLEKKQTHFRSEDDVKFCIQAPILDKFISKYGNLLEKDISALGYLLHLYTDKVFFEELFPSTFETLDDNLKPTNELNKAKYIRVIKNEKIYSTSEFWGNKGEGSIYEDYTIMNKKLLEYFNVKFDKDSFLDSVDSFVNPGIEEVDYSNIISVIEKTDSFISESYKIGMKLLSVFSKISVINFIDVVAKRFIEDNLDYLMGIATKNTEDISIVFASNNSNKLREVRELLEPTGIKVLSLKDVGVKIEPDENGITFSENALIKAEAIYNEIFRVTGKSIPVVADDSGLCIDVLGGFPGVKTNRFAEGTDEDKNNILLNLLNNPNAPRNASIVTAIGYYDGKNSFTFESTLPDSISTIPKGTNGFGYDPIFIPKFNNPSRKTLAEMSSEEKNLISPTGIALAGCAEVIQEKLFMAVYLRKKEKQTRWIV